MKMSRVRPRWRHSIAALALLVLGACDSSTEPKEASITGRWLGTSQLTTTTMTVTLTLAQNGTAITGDGTISSAAESFAVTVTGTFVDPNLSLTVSAPGFEQMNYSGRLVTDIQIDGTLNGSGFNNRVLNLVRQP